MSFNNVHSWTMSVLRVGRGMNADPSCRTPEQTLVVYEFEACPYCRKVREALSELDLDYMCHTSARGATAKRAELQARGGKQQYPYLIDPNTGTEMYESEAIIHYLHETYGHGRPAWKRVASPINTINSTVVSGLRPRGRKVRDGHGDRVQPSKPLELYNFEASPYCRKVRERLNELNLDVLVHNVGKKGKRRSNLVERGGKMMVPYLIDPNTGTEMYESEDILTYLEETYA